MRKSLLQKILIACMMLLPLLSKAQTLNDGLKLHYTFDGAIGDLITDESGNGYNGTLMSGATIGVSTEGKNVLILGADGNDYLDMGAGTGALIASLTDFSISTYVYVDGATNLDKDGNFIAVFSNGLNQLADTNGFCYLQAKRSRYSISPKGYPQETAVQSSGNIAKDRWIHMVYTQSGTSGSLYIDGNKVSTGIISMTPSNLGSTAYNFIGRPCFTGDAYLMNAMISDFRIYNRVLTNNEVLTLGGYPAELVTQWSALNLGDLSDVSSNLTLPVTMGTNGVTVSWASSNPSTISTTGVVTRPDKFPVPVVLTATLKYFDGTKTDSLTKIFNAIVNPAVLPSELVAKWKFANENITYTNGVFKVVDESENAFVGSFKNEAKLRTIGNTTQFNVIDLGNGTGYFDMDTMIGKAVVSLNDYTVGAFFRIDNAYTALGSNGNFLWNFSNSTNVGTDANGYIIGILKSQANKITATHWTGEQGPIVNTAAPMGAWHHFAYSQNGTTGTLYLDGVAIKTATVTLLPSAALPKAGRTGTNYNWIGRSCYSGDVYLRQTLVYGIEMYNVPLSADDLNDPDICNVTNTIAALNAAYAENTNYIFPELATEQTNLSLGDISAVTGDLSFPSAGSGDNTIKISWKTNSGVISSTGLVTRPDYLDATVKVTATLVKGGQSVTKDFMVKVKAKSGTEYASNVLLNYNFAGNLVSGNTVTDASEKHFTGTLMKNAKVTTIGTTVPFNVLELTADSSYFDMGVECGKLTYGLKNYSISVFYAIDPTNTFSGNGNFIYTFSNSAKSDIDRNGYMFGQATTGSHCVSSEYWASGNQATAGLSVTASKGEMHSFIFTQSDDTLGTVIFDGNVISSVKMTNLPSLALPKSGLFGTANNFMGRPNFQGDRYLGKAMIADFKLYNKVLTPTEISDLQDARTALYVAYLEGPTVSVPVVNNSKIKVNVNTPGLIQIIGLNGTERVSVYDQIGRSAHITNKSEIYVKPGIYMVKINEKVTKVIVK